MTDKKNDILTVASDIVNNNDWWRPTVQLRFVKRDGIRILQQKWISALGEIVWSDVPLEEEAKE
jgi:hypothetical protein